MGPKRLTLSRCRRIGRKPAIRGCHCISCTDMRHYGRQWMRDQRNLNTPYAVRRRIRKRAEWHKLPEAKRQADIARLQSANTDPDARLMFDQLRYWAKKDGLWYDQ